MVQSIPIELEVLIAVALVLDFLCGFIDSSSIVFTVISSRALWPYLALAMTAATEFAGPFLLGSAIAGTIECSLVDPASMDGGLMLAVMSVAFNCSVAT